MKHGRITSVFALLFMLVLVSGPVLGQNFGGWSMPSVIDDTPGYASLDRANANGDAYTDLVSVIFSDGADTAQSIPAFWTFDPDLQTFTGLPLMGVLRPAGTRVTVAYDMDGDNDDDMLIGNLNYAAAGWYENDGTDNPPVHAIAMGITGIHDIAAGDFDNDGDADAWLASRTENTLYYCENTGGDTWDITAYPLPIGVGPDDIEVRDVDGDMDLDLFSAQRTIGGVLWVKNMGSNTFDISRIFAQGGSLGGIVLGDVDGDGDTDMAVSMTDSTRLALAVQTPDTFMTYILDDDILNVTTLKFGDVDFDGDMDLVVSSVAPPLIAAFENMGNYTFNRVDVDNLDGRPIDFELVNIDGDYDLDIVSVTPDAGMVAYHTLSLNAFVIHMIDQVVGDAREIHADDMDLDGDMDVLVSTTDDNFYLFENTGVGYERHTLLSGRPITDFTTMDWDDDGMVDIIGCDYSMDELAFWQQTGQLGFDELQLASLSEPEYLDLTDLNGDELLDIAVAYGDGFAWYEQVDPFTVTAHSISTYASVTVTMIRAGDFNGDGAADLITSRQNGPSAYLTMLVNSGTGTFTNFAMDDHLMTDARFADINGDTYTDFISGYGNEFNWYRNNNPGYNIFYLTIFGSYMDHTVADVDLDGDPDPVVLWSSPAGCAWMENSGTGTFTQHEVSDQIGLPGSICDADDGGDGDQDFFIGSSVADGALYWVENLYADMMGPQTAANRESRPVVASAQLPAAFSMAASPNPFNAATTLNFSLPQSGRVTVEVFDVMGRRVAELADGVYQAGAHRIVWNAQGHASGMYFVRASAPGQTPQVRKLMLVR